MDSIGAYDGALGAFILRDGHQRNASERTVAWGSEAMFWVPIAGRWDVDYPTGETEGYAWETGDPRSEGFDVARLDVAYEHAERIEHLNSLLVVRGGRSCVRPITMVSMPAWRVT